MPTPGHRSRRSSHLYVALTDPVSVSGYRDESVLLVSVSTERQDAKTDPACILNVGEHEAVTRRSYVPYRYALVKSMADIRTEEASGLITAVEPVAPHVLDRICAGLEASPNTRETVIAFYREAERLRLTS